MCGSIGVNTFARGVVYHSYAAMNDPWLTLLILISMSGVLNTAPSFILTNPPPSMLVYYIKQPSYRIIFQELIAVISLRLKTHCHRAGPFLQWVDFEAIRCNGKAPFRHGYVWDLLLAAFSAYSRALSLIFEQTATIKIPRPSLSRAKVSINSSISASATAFFSTASARRLDCSSMRVDLQVPRVRTTRTALARWLSSPKTMRGGHFWRIGQSRAA